MGTIPIPHDDAPLIVTAHLDAAGFSMLDRLRRRHFPAKLNKVPAHLCLFHNLPGADLETLSTAIRTLCEGRNSFELEARPARFLGRGVALVYEADALTVMRAALARDFADVLTAQDREPFRAHVTIQNKADPKVARRLFETISTDRPPACRMEGIDLWRYLGGPWELVTMFPFADVSRG